jgi:hypothetical protein
MHKATLIVFSIFAFLTVTVVGCAEGDGDNRKGRIRTSKPAGKARTAADGGGNPTSDSRGGGSPATTQSASSPAGAAGQLKRFESDKGEIREVINNLLNTGAKTAKEKLPDGLYELSGFLRVVQQNGDDSLVVQSVDIKINSDGSVTSENGQEVRTANLKTFSQPQQSSYNVPLRFEIKSGQVVVSASAQVKSKIQALTPNKVVTTDDFILAGSSDLQSHVFSRVNEPDKKIGQNGVYVSKVGGRQQGISLISSADKLVVNEESINGRNVQHFTMIFKKVAAQPAAVADPAPATAPAPAADEPAVTPGGPSDPGPN